MLTDFRSILNVINDKADNATSVQQENNKNLGIVPLWIVETGTAFYGISITKI